MAFTSKKKEVRAPVTGTLRRLPGQSVRDERDKLLNDRLIDYFLVAFAFCFLAIWEWLRRWLGMPFAAEVTTIAAIVMLAYCAFRIFQLRKEIRNLNQAEKGERRVSELLSQLRRKRYVTFDDLLADDSNIDHVLVGPGGIFAIETKAYSVWKWMRWRRYRRSASTQQQACDRRSASSGKELGNKRQKDTAGKNAERI